MSIGAGMLSKRTQNRAKEIQGFRKPRWLSIPALNLTILKRNQSGNHEIHEAHEKITCIGGIEISCLQSSQLKLHRSDIFVAWGKARLRERAAPGKTPTRQAAACEAAGYGKWRCHREFDMRHSSHRASRFPRWIGTSFRRRSILRKNAENNAVNLCNFLFEAVTQKLRKPVYFSLQYGECPGLRRETLHPRRCLWRDRQYVRGFWRPLSNAGNVLSFRDAPP